MLYKMGVEKLEVDLGWRRLRFDGASIVSPEQVARCLLLGAHPTDLRVDGEGWEIDSFNAQVEPEDHLNPPTDAVRLDFSWQLPEKYLQLDIYEAVGRAYEAASAELHASYTPAQRDLALSRVAAELAEFERRGLTNFLRTIIYVIDVFREKQVIWGVGRGSSCASYVLFLLGLHAVDPIKFDVPLEEFFHD
jgi:DNA polymerase III alpha subunit